VPVVRPLNVAAFSQELAGHPDQSAVAFVINGVRHGFLLGFSPHS